MSRSVFAALAVALLLAAFPVGAAPAPLPRSTAAQRNRAAIDTIRAALRAARDARVTLEVPLGEEVTLPTPPRGKAYSLEIEEGGGVTRIVYDADAGRALAVSRNSKGAMRLTMNVGGGQGHQAFRIVAELRFVETAPPRRKQP